MKRSNDVALRHKYLHNMSLDLVPHLPALIEAVDEQQGPPRRHRLPHHAIQRRRCAAVLDLKKGVHPIPRGGEHFAVLGVE